ncbi:MAG: hypothetical protein ACRD4K_08285 [Candidatus Acidiferrales bacterium]
MYLLIGLLILAPIVYLINRNSGPSITSVFSSDRKFQPLNVEDPRLRIDLLARIHQEEYSGTHRDIFSLEAPAPPPPPVDLNKVRTPPPVVSTVPAPLDIPATFFGYVSNPQSGRKLAFFANGDDVFIVGEGETLLSRFRVVKIGNNTVDMEEVSSGRHTTLTMEAPSNQPQT